MILLGNLLIALAGILNFILTFMYWLIVVRCLISFVSPDPNNPIVRFITESTEPVLRPFKKYIPPVGMLDLSPIAAIAVLMLLQIFLATSLRDYGVLLKS